MALGKVAARRRIDAHAQAVDVARQAAAVTGDAKRELANRPRRGAKPSISQHL